MRSRCAGDKYQSPWRTARTTPGSSPPQTSRRWSAIDAAEKAARAAEFNSGEPGFGISACEYLAERKIILWGADTWASEAVGPGFGGENDQPFECHIKMMTKRGIWNIENLDLTQLVADQAYEFLFVWSPLKMKGATGPRGDW